MDFPKLLFSSFSVFTNNCTISQQINVKLIHLISCAVWPDGGMKSSQNVPKVTQKYTKQVILEKGHYCKWPPKQSNIWATFIRKYLSNSFRTSPNLVKLILCRNSNSHSPDCQSRPITICAGLMPPPNIDSFKNFNATCVKMVQSVSLHVWFKMTFYIS